jgi:Transposase DDE domain
MAHISGFDRSQVLLLPEAVEDYVGSDNPVRFIDAFVDGLDLMAAQEDRLRQPESLPRLPASRTMHERRPLEDALDRMAQRLAARPDILDRRREIVEHPFGSIKQWMNQGAFLMRGLDNVRAEFSLTALAYNLRRALSILGVEAMARAVAA